MDKNSLISKLNKLLPGAILETRRFGRSGISSVWIETQSIPKVAAILKEDSDLKLDWLESLSVVEFEETLVVTYFVRSTVNSHCFVIRASAVPASPDAEVTVPSVRKVWPMGEPMEQEAQEMFGVRFTATNSSNESTSSKRLPDGWKGFPLRKNYEFPKEFLGITHSRPFNTNPSKKGPL